MALRINDIAPAFTADTSEGEIRFHDRLDGHHARVFSQPRDFTPARTTGFERRRTGFLGVPVDSAQEHRRWKGDIAAFAGCPADVAIADDTALRVAKQPEGA